MVQDYVVLDLETTGLSPKTDKIIEIGAVRVRHGKIQETYATFINPGRSLEERTKELTGIRDEDLGQAPYMEEVLNVLLILSLKRRLRPKSECQQHLK